MDEHQVQGQGDMVELMSEWDGSGERREGM